MPIGYTGIHLHIYVSVFILNLSFIFWFFEFHCLAICNEGETLNFGVHQFKYAEWKYRFPYSNLFFRIQYLS